MRDIIKRAFLKYHDLIIYLIFGVLTTVINYLVYLPCYHFFSLRSAVSNMIAWVAAVAFAYLTNKPFVFRSYDWSAKTVIPELMKFVGTRIGSGGVETLILFVTVDILGMDGIVWKLLTSVLVVILNFVGSKRMVFRNK